MAEEHNLFSKNGPMGRSGFCRLISSAGKIFGSCNSAATKTWVPISKEISFETDLANWPPNRVLGTLTEFSNCQNCHGSQIAVSYNERQRKYETHYQSLTINCESCHGPGKRHIEIVSKAGFEKAVDIGMEPLATLSRIDP